MEIGPSPTLKTISGNNKVKNMGIAGIFVIAVFWTMVILLWSEDGPRTPVIFIVLWVIGLFGLPMLKLSAFFFPYEAILAIILFLIYKVKSL